MLMNRTVLKRICAPFQSHARGLGMLMNPTMRQGQGHYSTGLLQLLSQIGTGPEERASGKDRVAYECSMKRFANVLALLVNVESTVKTEVAEEICFGRNQRASVLHFPRGNK
jgi:hypothetical protein